MDSLRTHDDPLNAVYESEAYRKTARVTDLPGPLLIDVEVSAFCNLSCIMCTRQINVDRPIGNMTEALFRKVADQAVAAGVKLMRFSGYGEVLMSKDFLLFLQIAKEHGLLTHLTSNGLLLTPEISRKLVELGLDKVKFSFQGTDEHEYNRMRNTDKYWQLVESIRTLRKIRDELGSRLPIIQVATTVLDETEEQIQSFLKFWEGVADTAYHLPTTTWRLEDTEFGKQHKGRVSWAKLLDTLCIEPMTKLTIWNDGRVSGCCGDHEQKLVLGNLADNTLQEIWNSEKARALRLALRERTPATFTAEDKRRFPLCAGCMTQNPLFTKDESKDPGEK
jgi:MoaA/NifB/PqqE/SkfB family radical SAM enzyme